MLALVLFLFGHIFSATAVYLNHRFVFHGRLGKLPLLKNLKSLHIKHHKHAYDEQRNQHFEPLWITLSLFTLIIMIGIIFSYPFSLGMFSFALVYAYRHKRIHNEDKTSHFSLHHRHHHTKNPRKNFSGVYPVIDKVFGTYEDAL